MQRSLKAEDGTEYRVETEETNGGRLFIAVHGLQIELMVNADGFTITTTQGNDELGGMAVERGPHGEFDVFHE